MIVRGVFDGLVSSRCAGANTERDECARNFQVKVLAELLRVSLQTLEHPLMLGLANLAEPPILKKCQHWKQNQKSQPEQQRHVQPLSTDLHAPIISLLHRSECPCPKI